MSIARERLRWNGWGMLGRSPGFSRARETHLLGALDRLLGGKRRPVSAPVALEEVRLPPTKLHQETLRTLRAACGDEAVRTSLFERVTHACGRSLPDLLRLRRGEIEFAPDAVVYPRDEGAVAAVLRAATDANLGVIPFGGGSSVVGGVTPRSVEGRAGWLCLDTTRLDALVRVDAASGTATFQAGIDGPALEAALASHGLTLGHYPQSFEHSTLGGWVATRSTGQFSGAYGGIEDLLVALRVVTPEGVLRTLEAPRSATGPDLDALVLGSEGTLGVIVEATLRVRPAPVVSDFRGMLLRDFSSGVATIREGASEGLDLAMLRLSDATETELGLTLRVDPARRWDPTAGVLGLARRLGYGAGRCALVYGSEGGRARVRRALARGRAIGRAHGGLPLGRSPGRSWRRDRFHTPYLRDWLLDHGVAVDTFETAVPWSRLEAAHRSILRATRSALELHAGGGLAMAHLSHSYADGACLYFTMLYALDPERDLAQWSALKRAATEAVLEAGGTLSHHHGVGSDHAPWLAREKGTLGLRALAGLRSTLDPHGIMNPELWK